VTEPFTLPEKFPAARIHTHYFNGATLAEAFWQSVRWPWQLLTLGDPLTQPYARIPVVTIAAPSAGATLSGTVSIEASADRPSGVVESDLDLVIDGRLIRIGDPDEPVAANVTTGGFSLDTTTLTDGWHEIRVVAYGADAIRTQGFATLEVLVNNGGGGVAFSGPATGQFGSNLSLNATPTNLTGVDRIETRSLGRVLATLQAGGGTVAIPADALSDLGGNRLFAVAVLADGREVASSPLEIEISSAPAPAVTEAPTLPGTIAFVRLFEDITAAGFDWETTAPTAVLPVKDRYFLTVEQADQWPYLGDVIGSKGGVEFVTRYFAPETGLHDLAYNGIASADVVVDGVPVRGVVQGGLRRPVVFLEKGWHEIRFRYRLPGWQNTNITSAETMLRTPETRRFNGAGTSLHNHAPFSLANAVAPAASFTLPQLTGRAESPGTLSLTWSDPFSAEIAWRLERLTGAPDVTLLAYHGSHTPPILVERQSPDGMCSQAPVALEGDGDFFTLVPPFYQDGVRLLTSRDDQTDNGQNTLYEVSVPAGTTVHAIIRSNQDNAQPAWMAAQGGWTRSSWPAAPVGLRIQSRDTSRWIVFTKSFATATNLALGGGFNSGTGQAPESDAISFVFLKEDPLWETVATYPAGQTDAVVSGLGTSLETFRMVADLPPAASVPSNELTLDLAVATANAAPTVVAGPDRAHGDPAEPLLLNGAALDDGLPANPGTLTLAWNQLNGPGTATFADPNAAVTTVTFSAPGDYHLELSANDGALLSSGTLTVSVSGDATFNQPPAVDAGPDSTIVDSQQLVLAGFSSDDGLPRAPAQLITRWSKLSGPGTVTFLDASVPGTTAIFSTPGTYLLELAADDGSLVSTDTLTIIVEPDPNEAPTVDVGPNRELPSSETLSLDPVFGDDGLPDPPGMLSFHWRQVEGPGTATFFSIETAATEVSFDALGDYLLELRVSDGSRSAIDQLVVSVGFDNVGNTPPVLSLPASGSAIFTDPLFLDVTVSDDGLPDPPGRLTFTWEKLAGPGTAVAFLNEQNDRALLTFDQPGDYQMRLSVSDGLETAASTVEVQIADLARHRILWAWGKNLSGQAGPFDSGLVTPGLLGMAGPFPVGRGIRDVAVDSPATAIVTADGRILTSGSNSSSTAFLADRDAEDRSWFASVEGIEDAVAVAHAGESLAVLHADGTVSTWGRSSSGSLGGSNNVETRDTPQRVTDFDGNDLDGVRELFGRFRAYFVLKEDGSLWWWGDGSNGRNGLGFSISVASPMEITGATDVRTVAPGQIFTLILKNDGSVESTGYNFWGQLGRGDHGSGTDRSTFGPVLTATGPEVPLTGIRAIAAGDEFALALDENGQVWAWGRNSSGQLGQNDFDLRNLATRVVDPDDPSGYLSEVTAIAAGESTAYAVKRDGQVLAWGDGAANAFGFVSASRTLPVAVPGLPPVTRIWAGDLTAFAATAWATYDGFVAEHYTAQQIAEGKAAPDFVDPVTGLPNLVLYGLHRSPGIRTDQPPITLRLENGELVVETETLATSGDLEIQLQSSDDLRQWDPAEPVQSGFDDLGDTERATLRFDAADRFLRLDFRVTE